MRRNLEGYFESNALKQWRSIIRTEARRGGHELKLIEHRFDEMNDVEVRAWQCKRCGQEIRLEVQGPSYIVIPANGLPMKCAGKVQPVEVKR